MSYNDHKPHAVNLDWGPTLYKWCNFPLPCLVARRKTGSLNPGVYFWCCPFFGWHMQNLKILSELPPEDQT